MHLHTTLRVLLTTLVLALASTGVAQDKTAKTINNPAVAIEDLKLLLQPLSKAQLEIEAESWRKLVEDITTKVATNKIALRQKDDANVRSEMSKLQKEQGDLISRTETVAEALKAKGGKTEDLEAYLDAASFGPPTEDPSQLITTVKDWLVSTDGGIKWAINIGMFLLTLIVFRILSGIFGKITRKAVGRLTQTSALLQDFFVNVVKKVVFLIGLMVALSFLNVDVGPFLAAIGAVGFIIGFALQGTLSNFAAGLMILLYRPYDIGNFVNVAGTSGTVKEMTLVSTTLRTPDNQVVVVPNNAIWGGIITNVTGTDTRRIDFTFGIGYSDDIDKAMTVIQEVLNGHERILSDPAPVIKVHELADSSVNLIARPWCKTSDYWDIYWDITQQVKQRFDKENISIPFPQQDVYVHQIGSTASA